MSRFEHLGAFARRFFGSLVREAQRDAPRLDAALRSSGK
jgi:hypothetical protein